MKQGGEIMAKITRSERRLARDTLVVTVSTVVSVLTLGAVMAAEALIARERLVPTRMRSVFPHSGVYGAERAGAPIRFGVMGDSLAVGYGAKDPDFAPGVLLAKELSEASGRPVDLTNVAEVGAESTGLITQLVRLHTLSTPDVVLIIIGVNDVMHGRRLTDSLIPLMEVVRELRGRGSQVIVATCADLGAVHPIFEPLRFFLHWWCRLLATSQAFVVLREGGRSVSLADTLGTLFRKTPELFSERDHLHPSDEGYAEAARAILPSLCAAVGVAGGKGRPAPHRVYHRGNRHPLAWWAFRASRIAGARLTAAESATAMDPPVGRLRSKPPHERHSA